MNTPLRHRLRVATQRDRDWLERLRREVYQDLFKATWGGWIEQKHKSQFEYQMKRYGIYIIEIERVAAGMIQLLDDRQAMELAEIQIAPDYQRRGIATRLIENIVTKAHGKGLDVQLCVGLKNTGAQRLYHRLGFQLTQRTKTHLYMRRFA